MAKGTFSDVAAHIISCVLLSDFGLLSVISRICSVIVILPGHILYYFATLAGNISCIIKRRCSNRYLLDVSHFNTRRIITVVTLYWDV